ncbi:MAG TPA: nucleoside deaminase [Xanthobacteraceae bacterium]|nr:nucleoside deaminase [Xanthobacteraceae bacterium]
MDQNLVDRTSMRRCIALSVEGGEAGEYPYGVVIVRDGRMLTESINRVAHEKDVTRHAEVVAISAAQKMLGTVSLDDCTIYVSAEPCAYCCYAIRESRIARVVYALSSPHMGGVSKWPILTDRDISDTMPDVFAEPPDVVGGLLAQEAEDALLQWNPVIAGAIKARGLFVVGSHTARGARVARAKIGARFMAFLRWAVFDRFGRS